MHKALIKTLVRRNNANNKTNKLKHLLKVPFFHRTIIKHDE